MKTRTELLTYLARTVREEFIGEETGNYSVIVMSPTGDTHVREERPCIVRVYHYIGCVDGVSVVLGVRKDGTTDDTRRVRAAIEIIARKMLAMMEGE